MSFALEANASVILFSLTWLSTTLIMYTKTDGMTMELLRAVENFMVGMKNVMQLKDLDENEEKVFVLFCVHDFVRLEIMRFIYHHDNIFHCS